MDHLIDDTDREPELPSTGHPLQKLGARLTELLDDDHWAECERLLIEGWERDAIDRKTGAHWREDSSLSVWFPLTAEHIERLVVERDVAQARLKLAGEEIERLRVAVAPLLAAQPDIVAVRIHGPAATCTWQDAKEKDPATGHTMLDDIRRMYAELPADQREVCWLEYAYAAAQPNSGCPGDGSVCEGACRVERESPLISPVTGKKVGCVQHDCDECQKRAAQPVAQTGVPDGYALVSESKLRRAAETLERDGDEHGIGADLRAMLAASPAPTKQAGVPEGYPKGFIWVTGTTREREEFANALRDMAHELRQDDEASGIRADYAQSDLAIAIADALESDTLWRQSLAAAPTPKGG